MLIAGIACRYRFRPTPQKCVALLVFFYSCPAIFEVPLYLIIDRTSDSCDFSEEKFGESYLYNNNQTLTPHGFVAVSYILPFYTTIARSITGSAGVQLCREF
jgi:hypothetical protein